MEGDNNSNPVPRQKTRKEIAAEYNAKCIQTAKKDEENRKKEQEIMAREMCELLRISQEALKKRDLIEESQNKQAESTRISLLKLRLRECVSDRIKFVLTFILGNDVNKRDNKNNNMFDRIPLLLVLMKKVSTFEELQKESSQYVYTSYTDIRQVTNMAICNPEINHGILDFIGRTINYDTRNCWELLFRRIILLQQLQQEPNRTNANKNILDYWYQIPQIPSYQISEWIIEYYDHVWFAKNEDAFYNKFMMTAGKMNNEVLTTESLRQMPEVDQIGYEYGLNMLRIYSILVQIQMSKYSRIQQEQKQMGENWSETKVCEMFVQWWHLAGTFMKYPYIDKKIGQYDEIKSKKLMTEGNLSKHTEEWSIWDETKMTLFCGRNLKRGPSIEDEKGPEFTPEPKRTLTTFNGGGGGGDNASSLRNSVLEKIQKIVIDSTNTNDEKKMNKNVTFPIGKVSEFDDKQKRNSKEVIPEQPSENEEEEEKKDSKGGDK